MVRDESVVDQNGCSLDSRLVCNLRASEVRLETGVDANDETGGFVAERSEDDELRDIFDAVSEPSSSPR
jgi:hypothetical protein